MDIYRVLSYSKSVQGWFILTHLQKSPPLPCSQDFCQVSTDTISLATLPLLREKGDFNPSCCHGDKSWRVPSGLTGFPLSYDLFLSDRERQGSDWWGERSLQQPHIQSRSTQQSLSLRLPPDIFYCSIGLYCGWLLTLSVLCDDGAFCCFWGCGFSCCWCLW